jgi:hypothetical protein
VDSNQLDSYMRTRFYHCITPLRQAVSPSNRKVYIVCSNWSRVSSKEQLNTNRLTVRLLQVTKRKYIKHVENNEHNDIHNNSKLSIQTISQVANCHSSRPPNIALWHSDPNQLDVNIQLGPLCLHGAANPPAYLLGLRTQDRL